MERSQAMSNLWVLIQIIGWVIVLEGVAEFFGDRHSHALFRHFIATILPRDPASPRTPDNWEDWYNS
jgi:hypothetical protein